MTTRYRRGNDEVTTRWEQFNYRSENEGELSNCFSIKQILNRGFVIETCKFILICDVNISLFSLQYV